MGATQDNMQYVKAWGIGDSFAKRLENAKKNAVADIIFSGLIDGNASCETKPLVPEVNAKDKYKSFFDDFFQDNGTYTKFISNSRTFNKIEFEKGRGGDFIVSVYELKMFLSTNKILSK